MADATAGRAGETGEASETAETAETAETIGLDSAAGTGLPASIELAWGLRDRPGKGPRRGLSLSRIVTAAVELADAEGLAAVSMARVARRLNMSTMALYRYVAAKSELLRLMTDEAFGPPPEVPRPGQDWRSALGEYVRAEYAAHSRHPWVVRVPIGGPPVTPVGVAWFERGMRCLAGTGLTEGEKLSVMLLATGYARNAAVLVADIQDALRAADPVADKSVFGYGRLLRRLIDAREFPALTALVESGALDGQEELGEPGEDFEFGLARILDGIGHLIDGRSTPA